MYTIGAYFMQIVTVSELMCHTYMYAPVSTSCTSFLGRISPFGKRIAAPSVYVRTEIPQIKTFMQLNASQ